MGMDVSGLNPTSETGSYFRNNVWWWRPLSIYCGDVFPELWDKIEYPDTNDGSGLNAEDSAELGRKIQKHIDSGKAQKWVEKYDAKKAALPLETCTVCDGKGIRNDEYVQGACNACDGAGKRKSWATNYPINLENIQNWANFLKDCGGFEIW